MSETPKKMEFIMMKHSAAEFVKASRVALMVSAEKIPFALMISIEGLM
jgi:mannitol/fructose-specific phosphotransferase system IIA component (Ntr-type)